MRIAQIAPLWETVPARTYGGTELVIHLLVEELIRQGHEVTLFAANGSNTSARQEICVDFPLRDIWKEMPIFSAEDYQSLYPGSTISVYYELQMLDKVFRNADQFDIIHNHLGFITLPFANCSRTPVITTLHGAFKPKELQGYTEMQYFRHFSHLPFVSISNYQRVPCPELNYVSTIYHGLDTRQYTPSYTYADKKYLAFLGRFCRDKGPHHAIRVAKETGWKLIMAGKVDCAEEQEFFSIEVEPHLDGHQIQYIGELDHAHKVELLRNAAATLCPVTWPEPFGLVLTESMACATPVIAMRNGSIPEIIQDGQTGFVVDTVEEMITAVHRLDEIDRRVCRGHVEANFSAQHMAYQYLQLFEKLNEKKRRNATVVDSPDKPFSNSIADNLAAFSGIEQIAVR